MLTVSTDSADMIWKSDAVPATPPAREASLIYSPPANILCPNRLEDPQDFSSFFNTSSVFPCESGNKQSTDPSIEGSPSAQDLARSAVMQQSFENGGGGDNNGDGVGTSGSCSSNDAPSSSSSSMEIVPNISDKQPGCGNYGIWNNQPPGFYDWYPQGFHGWMDQGDRQRKLGDNPRMVNYGSKLYDCRAHHDWSSYGPMCISDPQLQLGFPRPPFMLPRMPATMPSFVPPPPIQCNYGPMANPGFFSPQMYIVPTNPYPDLSRVHPSVYPPAPLPAPPSMPFSLEAHKRILIMKQIEFYFSSENLLTDFYLKLHMDSFGWVSIHLIAGFRRIKQLTNNISFILDSLIPSAVVEVKHNRVRKRFGWNEWVRKPLRSQNNTVSENKS